MYMCNTYYDFLYSFNFDKAAHHESVVVRVHPNVYDHFCVWTSARETKFWVQVKLYDNDTLFQIWELELDHASDNIILLYVM